MIPFFLSHPWTLCNYFLVVDTWSKYPCAYEVCECDRVAAACIASSEYNGDYMDIDKNSDDSCHDCEYSMEYIFCTLLWAPVITLVHNNYALLRNMQHYKLMLYGGILMNIGVMHIQSILLFYACVQLSLIVITYILKQ